MTSIAKTKPRIFYALSKSIPESGRSLTMHEQEKLAPPYSLDARWFVEPLPGSTDIGCLRTRDSEEVVDATLLVFPVDFDRAC